MVVKNKSSVLKILRQDLGFVKKKFNVKSLGMFGSVARGDNTRDSDVDILVEFQKPVGFFKFIQLESHLTDKIGAKVDLVTADALKPVVKSRVLADVVYA